MHMLMMLFFGCVCGAFCFSQGSVSVIAYLSLEGEICVFVYAYVCVWIPFI